MTQQTEKGYLDRDYLQDDYMSGIDSEVSGMQVEMIIQDKTDVNGMQAEMAIQDDKSSGFQAEMQVLKEALAGMQALMVFSGELAPKGMQTEMVIEDDKPLGAQAKIDKLRHWLCEEGYLGQDYLDGAYLTGCMRAFLRMQTEMIVREQTPHGMQAEMQIVGKLDPHGMQSEMVVQTEDPVGFQTERIRKFLNGMQATMVIYNNTQLRIMTEFPSRGTAALGGNNWISNSTATGDFGPENLNTDIIEQVFRSNLPNVQLTCDTGLTQGVPVDTVAILGHNITSSATIQLQGSKDNFATPADVVINMVAEVDNMYWIAPTLPNVQGQNRWWRFIIQDSANPDGYIEIGAILFGASDIFTITESFNNPILQGLRHFKDVIRTEGFTNKTNDRALKKFLRLSFESLVRDKNNYQMLEDMMHFARTSLKCLVIPTPEYPSRFAVFGKLVGLPEQAHTSISETDEYITFDLEWDESL